MRDKTRQAVQKINRLIAAAAADVHVLAEHRGLQNQIAKHLQRAVVAFIVTHFLTLPLLKRMCPAATNLNMLICRRAQDRLLHG
ncbi:hypothetical protein D3C87_1627830 [compost metagenome]